MNTKPLISTIVSTYNAEKFIKGRLENLLNQTIVDKIEIIIVNSGSQQNEDHIIQEFISKYENIIYIRTQERESIYKAWNRGIKKARGKFITNANTDDRLRNDALEILANHLSENPNIALIYADQFIYTQANIDYEQAVLKNKCFFPEFDRVKLLERCIIGSQPMWRASLHFEDNLWFDESFEVCGDHDFELRVAEQYNITHLNMFLGYFYKSPQKTNKEFENPERTRLEVDKINKISIPRFIHNLKEEDLNKLFNTYRKCINIPIPLYIILKKIFNLFDPNIYPRFFFHTIEFNYYFISLILIELNKSKEAEKYCRKYLKHKTSKKITELYKKLTITK